MKRNKQKNSGTSSFPIDSDGTVWVVWGQPELYKLKLSDLKKIANSDWTEGEDGKQIRHKIVDNHGKTHMMTKSEAYSHIIDIPKKIIRLTESDLVRIVKRVIRESNNEIDELDEWIESNTYYISPNALEEKIKDLFGLGDGVSSHTERLRDKGGEQYGENWDKILITIQNNGDDLFKVWVNNNYEYIYGKNSEDFRGNRFYFNEYAL